MHTFVMTTQFVKKIKSACLTVDAPSQMQSGARAAPYARKAQFVLQVVDAQTLTISSALTTKPFAGRIRYACPMVDARDQMVKHQPHRQITTKLL
jgi:hypothetical protein